MARAAAIIGTTPPFLRWAIDHACPLRRDSVKHSLPEATFRQLAESPELGSLGEFQSPALCGVRRWRVKRFTNYLIFYRPLAEGIEVIRVLHGARDIDAIFNADS